MRYGLSNLEKANIWWLDSDLVDDSLTSRVATRYEYLAVWLAGKRQTVENAIID